MENFSFLVFRQNDLPPWRCSSNPSFTVFRNVLIVWDEDRDTRVLEFVLELPVFLLDELVVACEHEGNLWLVWRNKILEEYKTGSHVEMEDGDVWTVLNSISLAGD